MTAPSPQRGGATPRPWEARYDDFDGSWWVVEESSGRRVCYVGHASSPLSAGDAELIAAALNAYAARGGEGG